LAAIASAEFLLTSNVLGREDVGEGEGEKKKKEGAHAASTKVYIIEFRSVGFAMVLQC